jgi:hypothetical protein
MRSFTALCGTTATNSNVLYPSSFTTLANNNSAAAVALAGTLANDRHRYLLQKYFDNEQTVTFSTVGSMNLTVTGSITAGATSATLSSAWTNITCNQYVNFSDGEQQLVLFTNGSTAISWAVGLNNTVTSAISTLGVQDYNIPANISKTKNLTVNVGQLKYQPIFIESIQDWDWLNFLPYNSDIPNNVYIYNGTLRIYPIPSTTGNIITVNYKSRVPDMTYQDTTGVLATMTVGSTAVTGSGTTWNTQYSIGTNIRFQNLYIMADPSTGGDGIWYPILQFNSATSLTLALPVTNAPAIVSGTTKYTIGQMPFLFEDFHDTITHGSLKIYFSSIVPDQTRSEQYKELEKERTDLMEGYLGTKQVNVDLGGEISQVNPNLFPYAQNSNQ